MYNTDEMAIDELIRRALSAYFGADEGEHHMPTKTEVRRVGGLQYVLLHKGTRLLACYRVRNDLKLKRLRRLPVAFQ